MGWIKKGTSAKQKAKAGFFSNLRFRTKIMLGFMTVLVLSAINMGVAHFSFERIGDGIRSKLKWATPKLMGRAHV